MNLKECTFTWSDAAPAEILLPPARVLSAKDGWDGTYIGRAMPASAQRPARAASDWANTAVIKTDTPEARSGAIRAFTERLLESELRSRIGELAGLDLICWCAPKLCHGDALAQLVQSTRFYGSKCPHCAGPVASWLNWHAGLSRFTEAWVCQAFKTCGRRGESLRRIPQCLEASQPMLL